MTLETVNHIGDLSIVDPPSTDSVFEGDDHIRNIKKALQADMPVEHQVTGANAGAHKFKVGTVAARPAAGVVGRLYWNTDELTVQRDDGSAWQNIHTLPRFAQDTSGAPNQITVAFSPASPAITLNQVLYIRVANTNTGAVNIAVDGFSNVALKKISGGVAVDLDAGDLVATQIIEVKYNPTGTPFFQLLSFIAAQMLKQRNTWGKAQDVAQVTLTDGANIATDASLSNSFLVTLGGNRTLDNPTNLVAGQVLVWHINQDGTGNRTLAYGNLFKFPGGVVPILSTTALAKDTLTGVYDGTIIRASLQGGFA